MRPRTTRSPIVISNGTSTSAGVRCAHSLASNAARSSTNSESSAPSSAAPGSSSRSSRVCFCHRCSSQVWNAVPRRAQGAGRCGSGRRSARANAAGSCCSSTSWDTDSCWGNTTSMTSPWASAARSASNRSTDARHCPAVPIGGSSSAGSDAGPWAARTSAAPASTSARRPRLRSPGYGPNGSMRPQHLAGLGDQRVGGVGIGLEPLVHGGEAEQLVEERRRGARLDRGVPDVARGEQGVPGPGEGDVAEPPLLEGVPLENGRVLLDEPVANLFAVGGVADPQLGQVAAIAAQRCRDLLPGPRPVHRPGLGREDAVDETGDGHEVPLEPLRPMDGEDLHPFGLDDHLAGVEAVLLVLGSFEVGEERGERRLVGLVGEVGGLVEEAIEVRAADADAVGPGRHLEIDPDGAFDVGHQVGQRRRDPAAQAAQLVGQRAHPGEPLARVPLGGSEVVERLDDADRFARRRRCHHLGFAAEQVALHGRRGRRVQPAQVTRPGAQRGQVARPDPPPRAGQQPGERRPGVVVHENAQGGDDVHDLRRGQQSAEADDLDRQAGRLQRLGQDGDLRSAADEHRRRAVAAGQRVPRRAHPVGEPARFVLDGLRAGGGDESRTGVRCRAAAAPTRRLRAAARRSRSPRSGSVRRCGSWWPVDRRRRASRRPGGTWPRSGRCCPSSRRASRRSTGTDRRRR